MSLPRHIMLHNHRVTSTENLIEIIKTKFFNDPNNTCLVNQLHNSRSQYKQYSPYIIGSKYSDYDMIKCITLLDFLILLEDIKNTSIINARSIIRKFQRYQYDFSQTLNVSSNICQINYAPLQCDYSDTYTDIIKMNSYRKGESDPSELGKQYRDFLSMSNTHYTILKRDNKYNGKTTTNDFVPIHHVPTMLFSFAKFDAREFNPANFINPEYLFNYEIPPGDEKPDYLSMPLPRLPKRKDLHIQEHLYTSWLNLYPHIKTYDANSIVNMYKIDLNMGFSKSSIIDHYKKIYFSEKFILNIMVHYKLHMSCSIDNIKKLILRNIFNDESFIAEIINSEYIDGFVFFDTFFQTQINFTNDITLPTVIHDESNNAEQNLNALLLAIENGKLHTKFMLSQNILYAEENITRYNLPPTHAINLSNILCYKILWDKTPIHALDVNRSEMKVIKQLHENPFFQALYLTSYNE